MEQPVQYQSREKILINEIIYLTASGEAQLDKGQKMGFLGQRSSFIIMLSICENITAVVDKDNIPDVLYLDFQKVFDKAPHHRLMVR